MFAEIISHVKCKILTFALFLYFMKYKSCLGIIENAEPFDNITAFIFSDITQIILSNMNLSIQQNEIDTLLNVI